ncbi:MAG: M20/M25/M40 family metallo-hydrolase [Clostridia bacterium]|nr:M20/M25/M40 family metallo-hydrolase [Clostridia bacterium]
MNKLESDVLSYIEENKDELYSVLSDLVKIDTQNFGKTGNENNGQEYLLKICQDIGLETDYFAPDDTKGVKECPEYNTRERNTDKRKNLAAVYHGKKNEHGTVLASHMDTVTFGDEKLWTMSPTSGEIIDGKLFGRGAGDDKFGLAVAYFVIKALKENGFQPEKNILLGSYIDEEGGGGNGALALAMKYPADCYINLDSSNYGGIALGGGCFRVTVETTENDKQIASVFDVFEGLDAIKKGLDKLQGEGKTSIRLSSFKGGENSQKIGSFSIAIFTDMTREETEKRFAEIMKEAQPALEKLKLRSDGFVAVTRYFLYGECVENSKEAELLKGAYKDINGEYPEEAPPVLSDLSLLMHFGSKNSFNYGIPRGSETYGGAHQPNEHVYLDEVLKCAKIIALTLIRNN